MDKIADLVVSGQPLALFKGQYRAGGSPALMLVCESGEPYGTVSVNLPGVPLGAGEILVKTVDEYAPAREPLLACGVLMDTGRRQRSGFLLAEVWKIIEPQSANA